MSHFYGKLDDVFYFYFAANDTSGSGDDGASPAADVRLAGAAAGAAPVHNLVPVLLSHANFPAGLHEIAITASTGNGYANGSPNTYAVFCTLAVDAQNPSGFVGSFELSVNGGLALRGADSDNLKTLSDQLDDLLALFDNKLFINKATSTLELYNAAGDTVIKRWPLTDKDGAGIVLQGTGPANRGIRTL